MAGDVVKLTGNSGKNFENKMPFINNHYKWHFIFNFNKYWLPSCGGDITMASVKNWGYGKKINIVRYYSPIVNEAGQSAAKLVSAETRRFND
jgi:hypothetical protein